jgi:uncharacterized membrane protein YhaH (DUF805 family)
MNATMIVENFRRVVTTQYFDFNGRTARDPFWYYVLAYVVLYAAVSIVQSVFGFHGMTPYGYYDYSPRPLTGLLALGLLLPGLGIAARRLHDIDRSAWWLLIGIVPFVGWLVLIYWYVQPGTAGSNQFGPDPKDTVAAPPLA